jgi:hypothetical protein
MPEQVEAGEPEHPGGEPMLLTEHLKAKGYLK